MKKCPYCAEEIQDEAIVCRYCGRDLQALRTPTPAQQMPKPPAKKQSSLLIGAVLIVIICCGLFRTVAGNSTTATSAPEEFEKGANNVAVVTHTPSGTNTPRPTRTPAATRTPRPAADAYFLAYQEKFEKYMDAYLIAVEYLQQAGDDPTVILDSDWKAKAGLALGILNFRADKLAEVEPSPAYEKFHSYIVELVKETHLFTETYARGIDNLDANSIEASTNHLENMTAILETATVELENVRNK